MNFVSMDRNSKELTEKVWEERETMEGSEYILDDRINSSWYHGVLNV